MAVNGKTEEQLYVTMRRGMQAAADLSIAKEKLATRRDGIIQNAINAYTAQPRRLSELDALLTIAALAENQRLLADLEADVADAQRAHKQLQS